MEELIIKKYGENYSIEKLSKEFKIGKIKIKEILTSNNIEIKKRGGQTKYIETIPQKLPENIVLVCKKCNKVYTDIENKNGGITNHLKSCQPEITIPSSFKRRMIFSHTGQHWHTQFFNFEIKQVKPIISCLECGWSTNDVENKTGSLTKHIIKEHNTLSDYLEKYPGETNLFTKFNNEIERQKLFDCDDNYTTCKLCGEQFKTISNTHLKLHGITTQEYKNEFGEQSLLSKNIKGIFVNNLLNSETKNYYRSKSEIEIEDYIKSLNIEVVVCDKKTLNGTEIDLFLPEYNIGIEYNGLYWHSENRGKFKNYHIDKTKKCLDKNIRLIHIFSDEWLSKKDIVKNRLKNLVKKETNKINARDCKIVEISKKQKSDFLNKNHLQGNDKSNIFLGLEYDGNIVGIITFGHLRKVLGNKTNIKNHYELYRFCSLGVRGGFSKLFKYFVNHYKPEKVITYSNRNWTPSDEFCFYSKNGFTYVGNTKPNYSYTKKYDIREHRFNYRKDKLVKLGYDQNKSESQIMFELGYDKIWDTGNLKYEFVK